MGRSFNEAGVPGWENCSRTDLASLLPRWDQLEPLQREELEEHALVCPSCGPSLSVLAHADDWLRARAPLSKGSAYGDDSDCPEAEVLYQYGRGPGAEALGAAERETVAAHVDACFECESLVATLASPPPSPLIFDAPEAVRVHRSRGRRLLVPGLGVAAGLMAALLVWQEAMSRGELNAAVRFPGTPVLRGDTDNALLFPRDRVLATSEGILYSDLLFELAPEHGAAGYLVDVYRHDGGAFDEGTRVAHMESTVPAVEPLPGLAAELLPGHYTWEAWAVVDGLHVPLGRRDFEVVVDHGALDRLARARRADPIDDAAILELLHEQFPADARAFARTLPASPERDAYLLRLPNR